MKKLKIEERLLTAIQPYEKNPRINDEAVAPVAESIKQFGFKVPIIIDRDGVIVAGHTRYKAAHLIGLERVPCIVANDLTTEQIAAFRVADNKTAEFAEWDLDLLAEELESLTAFDVDMSAFGFEQFDIGDTDLDQFFTATPKEKNAMVDGDGNNGGETDQNEYGADGSAEASNAVCPHCGKAIDL